MLGDPTAPGDQFRDWLGPVANPVINTAARRVASWVSDRDTRRADLVVMLAVLQSADLLFTTVSSGYGDEHLQHLGVPVGLRPLLPVIKTGAIIGLVVLRRRPGLRSLVASGLVAYYAAAVSFHRQSGDPLAVAAPAAGCAVLAGLIV